MSEIIFIKAWGVAFFMGWNNSHIAPSMFQWYGEGVALGRLILEWEYDNGGQRQEAAELINPSAHADAASD